MNDNRRFEWYRPAGGGRLRVRQLPASSTCLSGSYCTKKKKGLLVPRQREWCRPPGGGRRRVRQLPASSTCLSGSYCTKKKKGLLAITSNTAPVSDR
ncbi:hypothetical protein JYU34_005086 [Plutella xylostella]|uniref:Uncharacterized protein n=1 Tax=Plutella xylostella TaxID=51655 RepID=A0ABQ7QVT8_PLUXY|nr:hypothetical protein JYU34_005086 [Plutella xylostella]